MSDDDVGVFFVMDKSVISEDDFLGLCRYLGVMI